MSCRETKGNTRASLNEIKDQVRRLGIECLIDPCEYVGRSWKLISVGNFRPVDQRRRASKLVVGMQYHWFHPMMLDKFIQRCESLSRIQQWPTIKYLLMMVHCKYLKWNTISSSFSLPNASLPSGLFRITM